LGVPSDLQKLKNKQMKHLFYSFLLLLIISCGINKGKKQPTKTDGILKSAEKQQCIEDSIENNVTKSVSSYSLLEHYPNINGITICKGSVDELKEKFGKPDSIQTLPAYISRGQGVGPELKLFYKNSYFRCWDDKLQWFDIKDSMFVVEGKLGVGKPVELLQKHYPMSYNNPSKKYRKSLSGFDDVFWIDVYGDGDGDGFYVLCNKGKISRLYYVNNP
jgi:hypothetical protein